MVPGHTSASTLEARRGCAKGFCIPENLVSAHQTRARSHRAPALNMDVRENVQSCFHSLTAEERQQRTGRTSWRSPRSLVSPGHSRQTHCWMLDFVSVCFCSSVTASKVAAKQSKKTKSTQANCETQHQPFLQTSAPSPL